MRNVLLWASQNQTLKNHVPRWRFARRALKKFMPGEHLEDAMAAAADLARHDLTATFTALGENVADLAQADAVTEYYLAIYDRIAAAGAEIEISVKLTHLGLTLDVDRTAKNLERLAIRAEAAGNWLWLDMEASAYVEPTLDIYKRIRAARAPVGICLQAYLHRTTGDIADLVPLRPGIRLVKGAYKESKSVAMQDKASINDAFFRNGAELLSAASNGTRVALATHDVTLLDRLGVVAKAVGVPSNGYDIQMLYGIRTQDQLRYAADGYAMRVLIAFGEYWYPWYVRRLAERPANLLYVARNLFPRSLVTR